MMDLILFIGNGLSFLVDTLFGLLFRSTGEILLWTVTLGKRKPKWDILSRNRNPFEPLLNPTAWLGFAFWASLLVVVVWIWT